MSATRQEMVASAAQTASGVSSGFSIPTAAQLMIGIDTTTGSSVTDFDLWLQASDDNGTTWYDYPADYVLKSSSTGANTPTAATLLIVASKNSTTAEQFVGVYKHIASDRIRLKWTFTGTSITFSASYVAK